jgi:hypothetical protein
MTKIEPRISFLPICCALLLAHEISVYECVYEYEAFDRRIFPYSYTQIFLSSLLARIGDSASAR